MLGRQRSFEPDGEVDEVLRDLSDRLPLLLVPAVDDQDRMEVAVSDVAEDGDGKVVLVADLLKLPDRLGDLGDGNPEVLHKGNQLCPRLDLRKGGHQPLAARPHLQPP